MKLDEEIESEPKIMEALEQAKQDARARLLALPPQEAQAIADQTLYPQYWTIDLDGYRWEESIPSSYGEDGKT